MKVLQHFTFSFQKAVTFLLFYFSLLFWTHSSCRTSVDYSTNWKTYMDWHNLSSWYAGNTSDKKVCVSFFSLRSKKSSLESKLFTLSQQMQTNGKSTVMSEGRVCFFTSDIQQKKKKKKSYNRSQRGLFDRVYQTYIWCP